MRAAGRTVDHHVSEGEGHGFSKEATIIDSYERMDAFLTRWVVQR
jgi:dipeptidyl aminopeptidase/acylaminoacyl peptidase